MDFLKRIGIIVYMVLMLCTGLFFILIFFNSAFPSDYWGNVIDFLCGNKKSGLIFGGAGVVLILIGVIAPYSLEKKLRKKRIVTFRNSDGAVSVAVSAIEDYVYKVVKSVYGIKDVRSSISVDRKGLNINASISISSRVNIPDVTEKIQMEVKNKLHGMLGLDENINIKIHIIKITKVLDSEDVKGEDNHASANIPYRV